MNMSDQEDVGKLFVGGLNTATTKDGLGDYFSQFGQVVDSVVMKNNETGRSRGFGFVTFKDPNSIFKVLQVRSHELDGKRIDPKECTPRSLQKGGKKPSGKCKLFLGGLPADITEDDIRHAMSRFGQVDQVVIMIDQDTKKCRGFGFLSFELEESIDQACAERFVFINDKQIECKRAEPRSRQPGLQQGGGNPRNNQNGVQRNPSYGQMNQTNWNMNQNPQVYNMPAGYPAYAAAQVPLTTSPVAGYANVQQQVQYAQAYQQQQQNYAAAMGTYGYAQMPANYAQAYVAAPQVPAAQVVPVEGVKAYGATNDYSQNATSYGPSKAAYGGSGAADAYSQAAPSANVQRFHPYKV